MYKQVYIKQFQTAIDSYKHPLPIKAQALWKLHLQLIIKEDIYKRKNVLPKQYHEDCFFALRKCF